MAEKKDRWPFDPMQPGDHEPRSNDGGVPDSVEHLHKQNPAPKKEKEDEQT